MVVPPADLDKSGWEMGEWTTEPDVVSWIDEATGLNCQITRHPEFGHLCGYVGVTDDHPWFGESYHEHHDVDVHGDLTFSEYIPELSSNIWWFGFDGGHGSKHFDKSPGLFRIEFTAFGFSRHGTYRNLEFMKEQVKKLALQIKGDYGRK